MSDGAGGAPRNQRYLLVLLFLVNFLNFYDRQILAVVTEPVRLEWGLSDTQLGWMSTAFILLYAMAGLPLGRLADTVSRTRLLAGGVAVWSAFTALTGVAWGYWSMFLARMGVGAGEATCAPAANSLIGDLFPSEQRARAISLFMLGLPVGIMVSSVVSGAVAREAGWRAAFLVAVLPGVFLAILISRIADNRSAVTAVGDTHRSPWGELWRIPTLRWLIISGALHNFVTYAVSAFLPAYVMRYHGLSIAKAALLGGAMPGAVGALSLMATGVIADRVRRNRGAHARLYVGALAVLFSAPFIAAALLVKPGSVLAFALLIAAGWFFIYSYYVTTYAAIHDVVRPELRGTAMAVYFFWMYLLGGAFGTVAIGMLSDFFAQRAMITVGDTTVTEAARASGLHSAFLVVPVLAVVLSLVLYIAARRMPDDLARLN